MVLTRPKNLIFSDVIQLVRPEMDFLDPGFVIHPPTSELAERLQIDPLALAQENYSGIYDETGDYIPQYADDPLQVPQGAMAANDDKPGGASPASDPGIDVSSNPGDVSNSSESSASD